MRKRKKKIWTTKNTHIKKNAKKDYVEPETWYDKLGAWIIIAILIIEMHTPFTLAKKDYALKNACKFAASQIY